MIEYAIVHVTCFFAVAGFILQKSESSCVKNDASFYIINFLLAAFIAPIWILLTLGVKLHGEVD
jgi:hypothetical protein